MMIDIPTIETERLIMRPFTPDDFDTVASFFADPVSSSYGGPCDRGMAWRKFAVYPGHWYLHGYGPWALETKDRGDLVGLSGLWFPEGFPEPEITYAVYPGHHGRGYATEAALRSRDFAYDTLGWRTVASCVDPNNKGSVNVVKRMGARLDGQCFVHSAPHDIYRHLSPAECAAIRTDNRVSVST